MHLTPTTPNEIQPPIQPIQPHIPERENPHTVVRRVLGALYRGKLLVVPLSLAGAIVGTGVAVLKPDVFASRATLIFQPGSEEVAVRPTTTGDRPSLRSITDNAPHLLLHPALAKRTVQRVGIDRIFAPFRPSTSSTPASRVKKWILDLQRDIHDVDPTQFSLPVAVTAFQANLEVASIRHTQLMTIEYTANDPHLAQDILTAYIEEAKRFHIDIYKDEEAIQLVEASHATAETEYEEARNARQAFLQAANVSNFELELTTLQEQTTEAERELRQTEQVKIPSLRLAIRRAEKALETMPPVIKQKTTADVPNLRIAILQERIRAREFELLEARVQLRDQKDPSITNIERKLKTLKTELLRERKQPLETTTLEIDAQNKEYLAMKQTLADSKIKLEITKLNLDGLRTRSKFLRKRTDGLAKQEIVYADLTKAIALAQTARQLAKSKLTLARIKERLTAQGLSSLREVARPTFSPERIGPQRAQIVLLGLLAGLGCAIGVLTLRSITDQTIRTAEELEQLAGIRVLATVPELHPKHIRRHECRLLSGC